MRFEIHISADGDGKWARAGITKELGYAVTFANALGLTATKDVVVYVVHRASARAEMNILDYFSRRDGVVLRADLWRAREKFDKLGRKEGVGV